MECRGVDRIMAQLSASVCLPIPDLNLTFLQPCDYDFAIDLVMRMKIHRGPATDTRPLRRLITASRTQSCPFKVGVSTSFPTGASGVERKIVKLRAKSSRILRESSRDRSWHFLVNVLSGTVFV